MAESSGGPSSPPKESTVRVVVKQAPLAFDHGFKGRGMVSLVEESPLSVMSDPQGARGRHFAKRYFLRVEGFRVMPSMGQSADDPLYLYVMREHLTAAQVSRDWSLVDGALVNTSIRIRALHDTTDSELVLFDQGLGGSLRGGEEEKDLFLAAAKQMPIIDLLHRADTHRGVHLGEAISKRAHALVAAGVTTAFDLLDLKSRGDLANGSDAEAAIAQLVNDQGLKADPFHFNEHDLKSLRAALHDVRFEHRGGADFEQELLCVDPGEIVACLVVQPPDIKPLRGTVRALAHSNLKHCRFMEAVLQQQKAKRIEELERALKPEDEEELSAEAQLEALLEKKAAKSGSSKNKGKEGGDAALLALEDKTTSIRAGSPGSSGANTPSKGTQFMLRLTGQAVPKHETPLQRTQRELRERERAVKHNQKVLKQRVKDDIAAEKARLLKEAADALAAKLAAEEAERKAEEDRAMRAAEREARRKAREEGGGASGGGGGGGGHHKHKHKPKEKDGESNEKEGKEKEDTGKAGEEKEGQGKKSKKNKKNKKGEGQEAKEGEGSEAKDGEEKKKKEAAAKSEANKEVGDTEGDKAKKEPSDAVVAAPSSEGAMLEKGVEGGEKPAADGKEGGEKKEDEVGEKGEEGEEEEEKPKHQHRKHHWSDGYAKEVRTLDNIENGRLLAKKIFKAENARKQALWRQEKGIGEEEELTPMALKKHGDPPSKIKRIDRALFDDILARQCGVVCLPTRSQLIHDAICDQYGLGVSGLDADSFAVALLLLYKLPLLQAAPAFLTPHDAFSAFDPGRNGVLDQPRYEHAMKSLLPHIDDSALGTAFVDHCDGTGGVSWPSFVDAFLELCDPSKELWRRTIRYPPTKAEVEAKKARTASHFLSSSASSSSSGGDGKKGADQGEAEGDENRLDTPSAHMGKKKGDGNEEEEEGSDEDDDYDENESFGMQLLSKLARKSSSAIFGNKKIKKSSKNGEAGEGGNGSGQGGGSESAASKAWSQMMSLGSGLAAGATVVAGSSSGRAKHLETLLRREGEFLPSSVQTTLQAVLEEEKRRAEKEQADRWAANEETTAAAADVRRRAAIKYKEETAMREKREAEAKVLATRLARHQARVQRQRTEREALLLRTSIDMQREERERKEKLRASVGADYLELTGLGMHKLGDFLDPKSKQGMKGVPQPRVALGQLLSLDVSRNFLRGVLDDQLLFQLVGLLKFDGSHNQIASGEGLQQLANCQILRLSHNKIGPSLPEEWGHPINGLTQLVSLSIDNNCLVTLPPTFGGLTSLRRLEIFNNKLKRLPETGCFGPLTGLVELRLRHNQLGSLPQDTGGMSNLQVLDLAYNNLVDLPASFSGLVSLRHLDLTYNRISEVDDHALAGMSKLQFFEMHHNCLVGRAPRTIGDMGAMNRLDLRFNQLEGLCGGDLAFENNFQLECLLLSHNKMEDFPAEIGKLRRLHTLEASDNVLTSLPAEMGALQSLHVLKLPRNRLTKLPPEMACLSALRTLELEHNHLKRLPPSFSTLVSLEWLNLSHNAIKSPIPSSLGLIPNLHTLQLQGNQVTQLPETIGYLRCLRALDVSNNIIHALPESLSLLRNLRVLDLRRNVLRALPIGLGSLVDLETIEVQDNPLDELPRNFRDPTSAEVLAWARRELVFFAAAVREWEGHEAEYVHGELNLHHFLEQVARHLPSEYAKLVQPPPKKRREDPSNPNETIAEKGEDDDREGDGNSTTGNKTSTSSSSSSSGTLPAVKGATKSGGNGGSTVDGGATVDGSSSVASGRTAMTGATSSTKDSQATTNSMIQGRSAKRAAAQAAAFQAQNALLRQQVTSFFFKAKQRGVVPLYASVSMNEQVERGDVSQLTKARRWKRAAKAKAEEAELFADSFDDEIRRFRLMLQPSQEAAGSALLHHDDDFESHADPSAMLQALMQRNSTQSSSSKGGSSTFSPYQQAQYPRY